MLYRNDFPKARVRSGMTLVEVTVALGVLAMVMLLVGQWATFSLAQQQMSERERAAREMTANLLEQTKSQAWSTLTAEGLQPLAEKAAQELGAEVWQVKFTVEDIPATPEAPRLQTRLVHVVVQHRTNRLLRAELTTPRLQLTGGSP
jgi:prepilin-type N-terminal cleavage/methylation domain-containing protein